ncbi:MAG: hypothetical protein HOO91_13480 [Bacteroidales bacterium]|nr:hypothetical protein [Bacteroidales bacterium]
MSKKQVLLTTAEMGYGHLRALYPFFEMQGYRLVILGQTDCSKSAEKKFWKFTLKTYEVVSRIKCFPLLGWLAFGLMNNLLSIPPRNKEMKKHRKSFSFWLLERIIGMGLCKGLINEIVDNHSLVFTSFYAPVIALSKIRDVQVYCQICDSDLSRVWVADAPYNSSTHYFVPCNRATERLLSYGVGLEKIHLTGFPFPDELVGGINQEKAKRNFQKRMILLENPKIISSEFPLKIAYIVGGAGAYSDIGLKLAISLKEGIISGTIILYLVAGIKGNVASKYRRFKEKKFPNSINIQIVESSNLSEYFHQFAELTSNIHILWTKPSELVFYSALGIPIIMTDPLGPQEEANHEWVLETNVGIDQPFKTYVNLWVIDKLRKGEFAKMARFGWEKGIRTALYKIPEIVEQTSNGKI